MQAFRGCKKTFANKTQFEIVVLSEFFDQFFTSCQLVRNIKRSKSLKSYLVVKYGVCFHLVNPSEDVIPNR